MEDRPAFTFTVCNVKEMTYYNLTANDKDTAVQWVNSLQSLIQQANERKAAAGGGGSPSAGIAGSRSSGLAGSSGSVGAAPLSAPPGVLDPSGSEERRGVLTKKGQQRLFVLRSDSLTWFLSGPAEKKAKGSLALSGARVAPAPGRPYTFAITPTVGKRYELTADSQAECDQWIVAIERVIDKCAVRIERAESQGKSGWLIKKGKRRWFVCSNGKLLWFDKSTSDDSATANNYVLLSECTVSVLPAQPKVGEYPFRVVHTLTKKDYVLSAPSERECANWVEMIGKNMKYKANEGRKSVEGADLAQPLPQRPASISPAAGMPPMLPSRSSNDVGSDGAPPLPPKGAAGGPPPLPSRASVDMSGAISPRGSGMVSPRGSVPMHGMNPLAPAPGYVPPPFPQQPPPQPASAPPAAAAASVDDEISMDGPKEKSGWLAKKGKRRWFVITNQLLKWYPSPPKHANVQPNGFLQIDNSLQCALRTPAGGEFPFAVWNQVNDYEMFAASKDDARDWVAVLRRNGARGEREIEAKSQSRSSRKPVTASSRAEKLETDFDGWLHKKGKNRWFMLKHQKLLWFNTVQVNERTIANGYLDVTECKVRRIPQAMKGGYAFLIYSKLDRKCTYLLLAPDLAEMEKWVKVLLEVGGAEFDADTSPTLKSSKVDGTNSAAGGRNKDRDTAEGGKVFGVPLLDHLRATGREGGIPLLVERCVDFIRQHGMDQEGIFRLSGDAETVASLRHSFDRGQDVTFSPDEDVNAVTGVLKLYLREMPDPLMTYELYDAFIRTNHEDVAAVKALIDTLPAEHHYLMSYLFRFFAEVSAMASVNKMASQNVAIVIGPNILKAREATMAMLSNAGQVNAITKLCITAVNEIFPQ